MTNRRPRLFSKPKLFKNMPKSKPAVESITTLHGTSQFSAKSGRSITLWSALMIANIIWTIIFIVIIENRFNSDQIVTKIYSDWPVEKIPFPAISICNFNMVSLRESKNIHEILRRHATPEREIEQFFHDLSYLKYFGVGSGNVSHYSNIMKILKKHYYNMETVMEEVHQKCNDLLVYCEFDGKERNCMEVFNQIQTVEGHCCTFNYNGVEDIDPTLIQDEEFDYYYDVNPDGDVTRTGMVATAQSGRGSGLKVVLDVEPKDYASWSQALAYGVKVLLTDPNDYPETRVIYRFLELGKSLDMKVEPKVYRCENSVRTIDPITRGCWFHDEVSLVHTNRYSYETCVTECRIRSFLAFCGCVPYKYPVERGTRICELSDLACLHYMKVHWATTHTPCKPECFKECYDKEYTILSDSVPSLLEYYPEHVTHGRNISELSALNVYYMSSTCNCYMMSLLIDFNYFIATYGGIFSLSFGASIITLFELIYLLLFFIGKLIWNVFLKLK